MPSKNTPMGLILFLLGYLVVIAALCCLAWIVQQFQ